MLPLHAQNPSFKLLEYLCLEVGGSEVQNHLCLHTEFKASTDYKTLKKTKQNFFLTCESSAEQSWNNVTTTQVMQCWILTPSNIRLPQTKLSSRRKPTISILSHSGVSQQSLTQRPQVDKRASARRNLANASSFPVQ